MPRPGEEGQQGRPANRGPVAGTIELIPGARIADRYLLIDDVADLPLPLHARVARALERHEIVRVNGKQSVPVSVRVVAATRRDLDREVENGNFREDLFYRLAVGRIELPPLRRREGDVALLGGHFWRELDRQGAAFPSDLGFPSGYRWPGNVRELRA
jgi:two-component system, NtrC family, response regulator HydG